MEAERHVSNSTLARGAPPGEPNELHPKFELASQSVSIKRPIRNFGIRILNRGGLKVIFNPIRVLGQILVF
jgi:hypothetical protein